MDLVSEKKKQNREIRQHENFKDAYKEIIQKKSNDYIEILEIIKEEDTYETTNTDNCDININSISFNEKNKAISKINNIFDYDYLRKNVISMC